LREQVGFGWCKGPVPCTRGVALARVEISIRGWDRIFLLPNVAHPVIIEIDPGNRFRGNNRENDPQDCDTSMWMASPTGRPSPRWTPKKDWGAISSFHC